MASLPLDNLDFMGRAPSLPGASARPAPVGGQILSLSGGFHQRAPPMQDVKMAGIRPSLPTTRPSSANSVAGQVRTEMVPVHYSGGVLLITSTENIYRIYRRLDPMDRRLLAPDQTKCRAQVTAVMRLEEELLN